MKRIKNKIESIEFIKENNLNKFPEILLTKGEEDKLKTFIHDYPAKYYAIRDKSKAGGLFKLAVKEKDLLLEISNYTLYTINVSSYNYVKYQKLVGEILISKDNYIYLCVSSNPEFSVRDAVNKPDYNFMCSIFDKKLNYIPYFNDIFKYVYDNDLLDYIIEFAVFDINIGINNENIIIYEVRTDY